MRKGILLTSLLLLTIASGLGCGGSSSTGVSSPYGVAAYSGCATGVCSGSPGLYGSYIRYEGHLKALNKPLDFAIAGMQPPTDYDGGPNFVRLIISTVSGVPAYNLTVNMDGVYLAGAATYIPVNGSPVNGSIEMSGSLTGGQTLDLYSAAAPFDGSVPRMIDLDLRLGGVFGEHLASTTLVRVP